GATVEPEEAHPTAPPVGINELQITQPPRMVELVTVFSSTVGYETYHPASLRLCTLPLTALVVAVVALTLIRSESCSRFWSYVSAFALEVPGTSSRRDRAVGVPVESARTAMDMNEFTPV